MHFKSLAAAAVAALAMSPAFAADLPSRAAPAPVFVPPAFTWTGFYVGLNAGYAFEGDGSAETIGTPGFVGLIGPGIAPGSLDVGGDGFIGGAQVGYNLQFGQFVVGAEADIQWLDNGKTSTFIGNPVLGTQLLTSADASLNYFGTVRARLGVAFDRFLVFATGGLAYGEVDASLGVVGVQNTALAWAGSKSDVQVGWTLGGGVEYAFTNNFTVKAEYLYYDLGDVTVNTIPNGAAAAAVPGVAYDAQVETRGSILRAGLNYKF